jgi:hypothetical protein
MQFARVGLEQLLSEIVALPADWLDDSGREVVEAIHHCMDTLSGGAGPTLTAEGLQELLAAIPRFLDVSRLVLGVSQDALATSVSEELVTRGRPRANWKQIVGLAGREPGLIADILLSLGLKEQMEEQASKRWTLGDVLVDRLRQGRGRAIAGIRRGGALEERVRDVLEQVPGITFSRNTDYLGFKGRTAKCDFAIPSKQEPKIIIECKGFEATGSKLTDVLGDVRKIIEAKAPHTYFFVVTDGRGWHRRTSDLAKLVEYHQHGEIDMIFTLTRLDDLGQAVRRIVERE